MEFNDIDAVGQEAEPGNPLRNHRLRRGVYLLPSALTVANLLCGYYAILAIFDGRSSDFDSAACAIGFAYIFDSMDGRIARAMKTESAFGREFDSLADVVSFGMAPAFLAYAWGIRSAAAANAPESFHLVQLGWLVGFFYVGCCAWRLARFNIQGMAPGGSRYFVGMPTPAAAGMIAATVHAFKSPIQDWRWSVAFIFLTLGLAALMTSTIRFYSFKDLPWTRKQPSLGIVFIALLGAAIWRWSEIVLLLIAATYTAAGVTLHVIRLLRHRLVSRTA